MWSKLVQAGAGSHRRPVMLGAAALLTVAFLVGLIGFAHTPAGRPLLGALGRAFRGGACPLGYDRAATPQAREQARARFAASHRGQAPAANRPALGFDLDRTRRSDVVAFMAARGITCRGSTAVADLVCDSVSAQAVPSAFRAPGARDLWFTFGAADQLVSVIALSRDRTAVEAGAAFATVTDEIGRQAGAPTHSEGVADPQFLGAGSLRQVSRVFAYADYYAAARATNMGKDFLLTEEYRSLPPAQSRL